MSLSIRPARPDDAGDILRLLRLLAVFEQAPAAVRLTEDIIRRDGFGPNRKFQTLLAEIDGRPQGMVVLYSGYSSWQGTSTLMVHDLFIEEQARGAGAGRALLVQAARLASEQGCCRLDVNVLAWNAPARRFYESLGFGHLEDWHPYRLDQEGMDRLAGGR